MIFDRYHNNINVSRKNAEKPRAYYIPCGSPEEIWCENREDSSRFKLLSGGKWAFRYFESFEDIPPSVTDADTDISAWSRIPVPSCWQLHGYDKLYYLNGYDFPKDMPFVPKVNPTGVYAIDFTVHDDIDVYSKYIVFEGVSSCVYLYLNGQFVGYSQGSHTAAEFDITGYLKSGKNRLTAIVTKWCDGSYLECCDDWKMSGIFRDVYLLVRPKGHTEDVFIKTAVAEDYRTAVVSVEIESPIANEAIATLFNSNGEKLDATVFSDSGLAEFTVEDPRMWSAEYPELYKVVIESANEFIAIPVGIRTVSVDNGVFRFNGRPIKLYGVNHHGFNSKTGCTYSYEDMKKDLITMKRNNINAIRSTDYPAEPRFYGLCDRLGFYVITEAEVNCGFMGSDGERRKIVDNPMWEQHITDRVLSMAEPLKNSPSVIMWSIGNDSGYGRALKAATAELKKRDNTRLIVYQSDSPVENVDSIVRLHPSSLDVMSEKNIDVSTCTSICEAAGKSGLNKPFILSEYCRCQGNGAGGLKQYFEALQSYENFAGAFVYEWSNRALLQGKTERNKPIYLCKNDFSGDAEPSGCCEMVTPECRTLPALKDHKNLAKPFKITPINLEEGVFEIRNCYNFSYMSRLEGSWELTRNGETVAGGSIGSMAIPPQKSEELALGYHVSDDGRCYIKISFASYGNDLIPDGEIVGFTQFLLKSEIYSEEKLTFGNVNVNEDMSKVTLSSDNFTYTYSKRDCAFSSLKVGSAELLRSKMSFNLWRAIIDNDLEFYDEWKSLGLDRASMYEYNTEVHPGEGFVTITSNGFMGADGLDPIFNIKVEWTVFANGLIELHSEIEKNPATVLNAVPRFGLNLTMDKSFDTVEFFGYGPFDSYCDRHNSSYMGKFTNKVNREMTDYLRPQSSGNHHNVHWGYVRNQTGLGLIFSNEADGFDFSAIAYSDKELQAAKHSFMLPQADKTVVSVDYKQSGVGNMKFCEDKFVFSLSILPTETMKNYPL